MDLITDYRFLSAGQQKKRLQICKTDKIICKFMNVLHAIDGTYNMYYPDRFSIVKYYISWDWLMPVFMKVKSDVNKYTFSKSDKKNLKCLIKSCEVFITSNKIKDAYAVIIKMIKLINGLNE
jgi:hypothetical protein